jgi:N utilization substance protein B
MMDTTIPTSRNQAQVIAMTLIYNALTYATIQVEVDVETLLVNYYDLAYDDIDVFVKEAVIKAIKHQQTIIDLIQPHLKQWTFSRLNLLTQAIFLLAVTHYHYIQDVDKKVVIDNAVKLAKKYVDEKDYAFVNAILDKVL